MPQDSGVEVDLQPLAKTEKDREVRYDFSQECAMSVMPNQLVRR
jgi:hypothetical protein